MAALDGRFRSNNHLNIVAGHELDIVDGENIRRIAHGDDQGGTGPVHRNDLVFLAYFDRDDLDYGGIDFEIGKIDGRNTILLGKKRGEIRFGDEAIFDKNSTKPQLACRTPSALQAPWSAALW